MKVAITGSRGKVGRATVDAFVRAGHEVTGIDLGAPTFERTEDGEPGYFQVDLTDAGQVYAVINGFDAVVHAAAIPEPTRNAPHVVFHNNLQSLFNVTEAAIRAGVPRLVNISSETVPGFFFAERPFLPTYAPVDELHPIAPQDPYALAKYFGELMMDAAVRRSDIRAISIRPSWVQHEGNYAHNLAPFIKDPSLKQAGLWSYIDAYDLADALVLAAGSDLPGHEVFYIASPDNIGSRDFAAAVHEHYGDQIEVRPVDRVDASGVSSAKAQRLLGWHPTRSWRDYLTAEGDPISVVE